MIFPAIDLQEGRSVRLFQGDFSKKTLINKDPVEQAEKINQSGIHQLHLVDLDGAKTGKPQNLATIKKIRNHFEGLIELGGGVRKFQQLEHYFELGLDRVIIGSAALKDPDFVKKALKRYGKEKIVIGVDGTDGKVAINGWLEQSETSMKDLIAEMQKAGAHHFVVTDVARDGTMKGANTELLVNLKNFFPACNIVASGGIRNIDDVKNLMRNGIDDIIVGKALYEGGLTLNQIAEVEKNAG
ncbi:phosphoribosylformimino-5-aminoimidazole carboxamide ribotide isomerase [Liquorilactobacillus sucicola DSM 21376 = JCM 15457]|uniref:1-(5-phosphoribosyl)-5-[(5-phosphoribosylamino)methylideneamino] imidazole-4-carboxamide isomerase n=1 Tax=Liquorilactobacillus sucicola DSM 21376 = JCM 15457 TaxID=1423806 RepID=A0A023D0T7_9LACO|nr:1-(5-phosphoribosyl)-5-[(5-phosphoribosylamino)methylideneamino]imidazole-4-carboxamide isomerase [Liquorilactobacillus sucicola]KRN06420.1 phosphoribosylformimino-5-aminoimidazole carboxamide ribotide isomerase [Liquorilactobacillus sucicola DSM 21376 = JCM 15457]GAJ27451.1 phosphoribosylformimino-5-aminoimidazole carboxamide ribotide isomerase [Liquorilactobacillus sucicola DSM 21376 = JCM 15457]